LDTDVFAQCYALVVVHATLTHPFNAPFSGTIQVSRYQKGKTSVDFTEARDSEWQWHQLGHMQVCFSLHIDNHASTPPLVFYRPDALPAAQPTIGLFRSLHPCFITVKISKPFLQNSRVHKFHPFEIPTAHISIPGVFVPIPADFLQDSLYLPCCTDL